MAGIEVSADPLASAKSIAAEVISPRAAHHDATGEFPSPGLEALGNAGLLGLLVPPEYGGLGASYETFAEVVEILGQACPSTAMIYVMHHNQYVMIVDYGTAHQKETFLPPIAAGEVLVASATTEPETGGNAAFCVSAKETDGERIRLTATKPVVTSANYADWIFCTTRASSSAAGDELSMVIMPGPKRSDAVEPFGVWDCVGMRATSSTGLRFDGCEVPLWHQIGPEDSAHMRATSMTLVSRVGFAAAWQGIATAAFEETLGHVRRKYHDFIRREEGSSTATWTERKAVAGSESTQRQLAEMRVRMLASRELLHSAARHIDARREDILNGGSADDVQDLLWSARIACGEAAVDVTRQGLRLCGVTGLRAGTLALERHMRDALTSQVMAPSEDSTKLMLGLQLAGGSDS